MLQNSLERLPFGIPDVIHGIAPTGYKFFKFGSKQSLKRTAVLLGSDLLGN
jgi:hypothetical protein